MPPGGWIESLMGETDKLEMDQRPSLQWSWDRSLKCHCFLGAQDHDQLVGDVISSYKIISCRSRNYRLDDSTFVKFVIIPPRRSYRISRTRFQNRCHINCLFFSFFCPSCHSFILGKMAPAAQEDPSSSSSADRPVVVLTGYGLFSQYSMNSSKEVSVCLRFGSQKQKRGSCHGQP